MNTDWAVERTTVTAVEDHPNADRLSLVTIFGFICISAKNEDGSHRYKVGDEVFYIPEASILPDSFLQEYGFWRNGRGILSGSRNNRVKAIRLRGILSQGIIIPAKEESASGWAESIGIYKYEPPAPSHIMNGKTKQCPHTMGYNVNQGQKFTDLFDPDDFVVVTEKIHGTLVQFGFVRTEEGVERIITSKGLGGKGFNLVQDEDKNIYVRIATPILDDLEKPFSETADIGDKILFFGEIFGRGIQDLHYSQEHPSLRIFDIFLEGKDISYNGWLDDSEARPLALSLGLKYVPVIWMGHFADLNIPDCRDGKSKVDNLTLREGVVVKTSIEQRKGQLRKQAKFVSPDYLTRKGGTEYT